MEKIRIFADGQLQYVSGRHRSKLFNPFEVEIKGGFWRWVAASFDHAFDKIDWKRKMPCRDENVERLAEIYKRSQIRRG